MPSPDVIIEKAQGLLPKMIEIRRYLHMHPELGGQEYETSRHIAETLEDLDIETKRQVGGTGVVGLLRGKRPGETVALRADMDALPIQDKKDVIYRSRHPGVMHACGHDGHVAMLLGAATLLSRCRDELDGNVKFIFQPAEEGPGGAALMVREGVMDNPRVSAIFGMHIWPDLPLGKVGLKSGPAFAATDEIFIKVIGQGGHGAAPHRAIDAIVVASNIVLALQALVSRETDPMDPVVLTVGTISGGYKPNVIADEVTMGATLRTLSSRVRADILRRIERTAHGIAKGLGATCEVTVKNGYPVAVNSPDMTDFAEEAASKVVGEENIVHEEHPSMGSEDFGYYLQRARGCFLMLGAGTPGKPVVPAHSPKFDFDERAMAIGCAIFAQLAFSFCVSERWISPDARGGLFRV
ncbi:MAG TPA: amidohydrolase [Firmicutes bacterium]|nr:amidohydrolase [Bacillota bacterium]